MNSRAYVASFGFKGPDQQKKAGVLSGGERNRLNLALTLKMGGNLLLLDEPTNDLDVETLSSLEDALLDFPGCAVVTSHDRWFLDRVATHILAWEGDDDDEAQVVLVRGQLRGLRGQQDRAPRRRGGPPAPGHPPSADPRLTTRRPGRTGWWRSSIAGCPPISRSATVSITAPNVAKSAGRTPGRPGGDAPRRRECAAADSSRANPWSVSDGEHAAAVVG